MIEFVSTFNIATVLLFLLIAISPIIIVNISFKKEKRKNENMDFDDWVNEHELFGIISVITSVLFGIVFLVVCSITITTLCNNHLQEPSYYESIIIKKETITDALKNTKDIVNTPLYLEAIDFNSNLAKIKSKFNDSKYALNFSGNFDWNNLTFIELKE